MDNKERTIKFIEQAKKIHSNEDLDYSKVKYKNNRTKVCIIDNDLDSNGIPYGEFWQTPSNHLKGQSHPRKRGVKIQKNKSFTTETFIKKAKEIHANENIDYSKVEYVNMHTKVCIIDNDLDKNNKPYGEYWQEPNSHLKGCGHPRKGKDKSDLSKTSTLEEFIRKGEIVHKNKNYSYEKTKYINNRTKVIITCHNKDSKGNEHGDLYVTPSNFLKGKGCPICNESHLEQNIRDWLIENNINFQSQKRFDWLGKQSLDFYLLDYNIAIECQGIQHFKPIDYFGGKDGLEIIRNRDILKKRLCDEHKINIIYFTNQQYDEFLNNKIFHTTTEIMNCINSISDK